MYLDIEYKNSFFSSILEIKKQNEVKNLINSDESSLKQLYQTKEVFTENVKELVIEMTEFELGIIYENLYYI